MPDSRLHYFPYGATRAGDPAALPTEYNFTGQRLDMSTGLLYYGARYYDPALGRFISADTVVPEPGNPQALTRSGGQPRAALAVSQRMSYNGS